MTTQTLTLDQCPPDIRAFFLADPAYQSGVRVTKSAPTAQGNKSHAIKTLKTGIKKAANLPGFAAILGGAVSRNMGDAPRAIPVAPAPTTAPTDTILTRSNPAITRQASNTPKSPIPSKHDPVTYATLQAAIDTALSKQRDDAKAEAFNAGRSAYSRITPTKESDVQGGGSGDAWSLRNFGGKLAATVLNATARKGDSALPNNSAWRPMSGGSLKA